MTESSASDARSLLGFFRAALRFGSVGFGSSQRVQGQLESGLVRRSQWLTEAEYASTLNVVDLLPGAPSANTLALVGQRLGGWTWSLAGYVGFVLPGVLLTLAAAALYVRFDLGNRAEFLFQGFGAATVGAILALTFRRLRGAALERWQIVVAGVALVLTVAGKASPTEVVLLGAAAGLVVDLGVRRRPRPTPSPPPAESPPGAVDPLRSAVIAAVASTAAVAYASGLDAHVVEALVLYFRTGLGAYGGGLAIIPHLSERLDALDWLTRRQFADAVSVSLLTPGPALLMATFAEFLHRSWAGATAATVALLAAPWALVRLAGGWLERVREHVAVRAAARGLQPAVIGLMGSAALVLGANFHGPAGLGIAAVSAVTLVRYETNPAWIIAAGGVLRFGLHLAGF